MQKNGNDTQLKDSWRKRRSGARPLVPFKQSSKAKGALQSVLKIMVLGIDRLVISITTTKSLFRPAKSIPNRRRVIRGKQRPENRHNFVANDWQVLCIHIAKLFMHQRQLVFPATLAKIR